jgi:ferric-dicitrate binding protein FerR (iron transport regulator)
MSNDENNKDHDVADLIRAGGLRESAGSEREQRAYKRVSAHWQSTVEDHKSRSRPRFQFNPVAIAASVAAAVLVGVFAYQELPEDSVAVATFTRIIGSVEVDGAMPGAGDALPDNMQLRTAADSRAALVMADGQILRIDENSELIVFASERLRLNRGAVYIDSADSDPSASVFVETALGVANDVGTRFQVRIHDEGLFVGVRDGLVTLSRPDAAAVAIDSGWLYELSFAGDAQKRPDDTSENWQWVEAVVPTFELEGATLLEYLSWYAREKGVALEFANEQSQSKAVATRLSGSINGLSLDDSLATVRRIAPFSIERDGNAFRVRID